MAEQTARKRGCGTYFLYMMLIGGVGGLAVQAFGPPPDANRSEPSAAATMDPLVLADQRRLAAATAASVAVRDAMRDPDSLIIESALVSNDAALVCIAYRARNGFGGMNREFVAFENGTPRESSGFWNRKCTKPLANYTDRVRRRM